MGRPALADAQTKEPRLYNHEEEIGEKTNIATAHLEVVSKLTNLAEKMEAEIGGGKSAARRPAGNVENPTPLYPAKLPERKKKKRQ